MSAQKRDSADIAALRAEYERLDTVSDVLSDILGAACDVSKQKGFRDCAAEDAKRDHWRTFNKPVYAEYYAAADAYCEAEHSSELVAKIRAERERTYVNDPEMRELIVKARTDLAARRASHQPAERDRRRSR
ncbi:hypothetical protein [Nocardia tengchongensis]